MVAGFSYQVEQQLGDHRVLVESGRGEHEETTQEQVRVAQYFLLAGANRVHFLGKGLPESFINRA